MRVAAFFIVAVFLCCWSIVFFPFLFQILFIITRVLLFFFLGNSSPQKIRGQKLLISLFDDVMDIFLADS